MKKRHQHIKDIKGDVLTIQGHLTTTYQTALPYSFTQAQTNAIKEIAEDVTSGIAMNRMLQGDVGSGKTDIAVMALLFAIQTGKKGAVLAPTEILATQHDVKFKMHLQALNVPVVLLKGQAKSRTKILELLQAPEPLILIGTHAILEDDVIIHNLGLIVIDEQHRFGVHQRLKLQQKGFNPHCLYMTATPIPRSLMLTAYGDLFKTIMDELPPGRVPVKTYHLTPFRIPKVYEFCKEQLKIGHQIYFVYPLVKESEKIDLQSAIEAHEQLRHIFIDHTVGLLHGKMKTQEKDQVMQDFKNKTIKILVSTTVIEVGIDVPNATVMVIWHAERFGLSQLHQLRGRIGRGGNASYCFLVSQPKGEDAKKRIKAMIDTTDGFKIAEYDLSIRGPGDLLGTRQSGMPDFKIADLIRDEKTLILTRKIANQIIQKDPGLTHPLHQEIKKIVENETSNLRLN